jgi:hypothetical protein
MGEALILAGREHRHWMMAEVRGLSYLMPLPPPRRLLCKMWLLFSVSRALMYFSVLAVCYTVLGLFKPVLPS